MAAWFKVALFFWPVILGILIIILVAVIWIRPLHSNETFLAIGQQSSMADALGKEYARYFRQHGLELETYNTVGLEVGLQKLEAQDSRINASFLTAGVASSKDFPGLVSLGSVQISPIWLFYRGKDVDVEDPFEYYRDRSIAVGAPGTVTNTLFNRLMEMNNPGTGDKGNFLKLTHVEAAKQLQDGVIEAMFVVDGYQSPVIQSLLQDPKIKLMNFPLADAYIRKLPFLQKIVVPKASLDIGDVIPPKDIVLLASSLNLLVEKEVHPAIQWAFLMAAQENNFKTEHFFAAEAGYPQYRDKSFPLSQVAERYYKSGTPAIFHYLPLWMAAWMENVWVVLLTLFLVILPLINKVVGYRAFASQKLLWSNFWELRFWEDELAQAKSREGVTSCVDGLTQLEKAVDRNWVKSSDMRHYYNLQRCIAGSLENARKQLAKLESQKIG